MKQPARSYSQSFGVGSYHWAGRRTGGEDDALWVIEGVATYGAHLASLVTDTGY